MELEIPNLDNPHNRKDWIKLFKVFRALRKVSHARAQELFHRCIDQVKRARIVVGHILEEPEKKYLLKLYKKSFPDSHDPEFVFQKSIQGGVRFVYGDEMVELNLDSIKQQLQKF